MKLVALFQLLVAHNVLALRELTSNIDQGDIQLVGYGAEPPASRYPLGMCADYSSFVSRNIL